MKVLIYGQRKFLAIRPEMSVLTFVAMKLIAIMPNRTLWAAP